MNSREGLGRAEKNLRKRRDGGDSVNVAESEHAIP